MTLLASHHGRFQGTTHHIPLNRPPDQVHRGKSLALRVNHHVTDVDHFPRVNSSTPTTGWERRQQEFVKKYYNKVQTGPGPNRYQDDPRYRDF